MRNREEFEEYVRGLADKKLAKKQTRRTKIRRITFVFAGCAAACICVVLLVHMNSALGTFGRKDYAENGFPKDDEIYPNGNQEGIDSANEMSTFPLDAEAASEKESSDICISDGYGQNGNIGESIPEYVNVRLGESEFKLQEQENISRLVYALGSFEHTDTVDTNTDGEVIVVELVYSDKTVSYRFEGNSVEVSGDGNFSISPEKVSELYELLDSLIRTEK